VPTGVVIRPMVAPASVNQSAPSGPATIAPKFGQLGWGKDIRRSCQIS
jgi:hypothetical protein